jgi:hypothetical protein
MSWGLALIEHAAGKPEQSNFGDRQSRTTARNCAMPDIMANRRHGHRPLDERGIEQQWQRVLLNPS